MTFFCEELSGLSIWFGSSIVQQCEVLSLSSTFDKCCLTQLSQDCDSGRCMMLMVNECHQKSTNCCCRYLIKKTDSLYRYNGWLGWVVGCSLHALLGAGPCMSCSIPKNYGDRQIQGSNPQAVESHLPRISCISIAVCFKFFSCQFN